MPSIMTLTVNSQLNASVSDINVRIMTPVLINYRNNKSTHQQGPDVKPQIRRAVTTIFTGLSLRGYYFQNTKPK